MMLAYAAANLGWDVHFFTDHRPSFLDDLEPLAPGQLKLHASANFMRTIPTQTFDWVFVIPTGIFLPEFYEGCLDFARAAGARIGLINFETGTWFNARAPEPRDPRLWDYWRRVCVEGALVLSSARESNVWARGFYGAPQGEIRFEVWQPPVNSIAAQRFDGLEKDGSVVAFVRPQDTHKGSELLTRLDPHLFRDRTLNIISGREVPAHFRAAIAKQLSAAQNARAFFYLRISDQHKFRLLTSARAVLFPSLFEGYGYPPIEAAYSGTECAVFDLPVLRETVGGIARFAPTPDMAGFESATAAALSAPERRAELREAVFEISDFHRCAVRLGDILLRSADRIAPLPPRRFRVSIGPFAKTAPEPPETVDRNAPTAPFPPYVVSAFATTGGESLLTLRAWFAANATALEASLADSVALPIATEFSAKAFQGMREARLYVLAPKDSLGQRILITARAGLENCGAPIEARIDQIAPANELRPVLAGVSEDQAGPSGRRIRGWALAREPLSEALFCADGKAWFSVAIDRERRDIGVKFPAYGTAQCEFLTEIPAAVEPDRGKALLFCISSVGGSKRAVDALVGWPPAPKAYYAEGANVKLAVLGSSDVVRPPRAVAREDRAIARPRRPRIGEITLAGLNDSHWRNGVALAGGPGRLGAVALPKGANLELVKLGAVLRFASGRAQRIVAVEQGETFSIVTLDGTLEPGSEGPARKVAVHDGDWTPSYGSSFVVFPWTDTRWWRGVWSVRDSRFQRGFTIKTSDANHCGLTVGATLRFAASGEREIEALDESNGNTRVWLNGRIRPFADMAPNAIIVVDSGDSQDDIGLVFQFVDAERNSIVIDAAEAHKIRKGVALRFAEETARVLAVRKEGNRLHVTLNRRLKASRRRKRTTVCLVDEADLTSGSVAPYRFQGYNLRAKDSFFRTLALDAVKLGAAVYAAKPLPFVQRRALVISAVSPSPANQGNRCVTRNLIRHLIDLGFQCDVVVQNWVDAAAAADEFGPNARFLVAGYPDWEKSESRTLRKSIADAAQRLQENALDARVARKIDFDSSQYHPYFIVRDETVELARALYRQHAYDAVVVNYTHMIRVAEELQDIRPLPPTAVFTHDALSRLPREFGGKKLDLMYRACSDDVERDVLNAIPGATIVAISTSEAEYFEEIGVENPIVVVEYDAAEEMAPYIVPDDAFERRRMIFHGSANSMNVAGLNWFVDECWAQILAAVPDARLVVCGRVGAVWKPELPGIEIVGELPRDEMIQLCSRSSVAINPCVAGTGLKIKTVEMAALALPAVCLPTAVDGLQDIADKFAIVAEDGDSFAAGCIALMTDRERWIRLRSRALEVATHRFRAKTVYGKLDEAMGWDHVPPLAASREPDSSDDDGLPEIANPVSILKHEPNHEAAQFALGKSLAHGGHSEVGWTMVDQVASSRRGDWRTAMEAAEIGLQVGAPWRAAIYAARMVAQRPTQLPGYLLMGRALLACNLPAEAVEALEQGLMVAPFDAEAQRLLVEALTRAKREGEVEKWRARPTFAFALGQYLAFRPSMPGLAIRGFDIDPDGALSLSAGEGAVLLPAPHGVARRLSAALDIAKPKHLGADVEIDITLEWARCNGLVRAKGPGVQTVTLEADADVFASGFARLGLRIVAAAPLDEPLQLIGIAVDAQQIAEVDTVLETA